MEIHKTPGLKSLGAVKTLSHTVNITGRCASEEGGLQQLLGVYPIFKGNSAHLRCAAAISTSNNYLAIGWVQPCLTEMRFKTAGTQLCAAHKAVLAVQSPCVLLGHVAAYVLYQEAK